MFLLDSLFSRPHLREVLDARRQWLEHDGSPRGTRRRGWAGAISPSCPKSSKWSCCARIPGAVLAAQPAPAPSEWEEERWVLLHVQWGLDLKTPVFVGPVNSCLVVIFFFFFFVSYIGQPVTEGRASGVTGWFWVTGRLSLCLQFFHYFPTKYLVEVFFLETSSRCNHFSTRFHARLAVEGSFLHWCQGRWTVAWTRLLPFPHLQFVAP